MYFGLTSELSENNKLLVVGSICQTMFAYLIGCNIKC